MSGGAGRVLAGVWYGNSGWDMPQAQALECWQGRRNAVLNVFTSWCERDAANLFERQLPAIVANGNVPLVTWEPFLCDGTPADIATRIARGDHDAYIEDWSGRLRAFLAGAAGRHVYLRPGHEMNGNWYPWAGAPEAFVRMWRRTVDAFRAKGLDSTQVRWVFAVNNTDQGTAAESYWPGEDYVDWVGIDGYNWGTSREWSSWQTPAQVFGPMAARLRALTSRPLAITEAGCTTAGGRRDGKAHWIAALGDYVVADDVRMVVWFNEDKETDWAVFGGSGGDGTFRDESGSRKVWNAWRALVNRPEFSAATADGVAAGP